MFLDDRENGGKEGEIAGLIAVETTDEFLTRVSFDLRNEGKRGDELEGLLSELEAALKAKVLLEICPHTIKGVVCVDDLEAKVFAEVDEGLVVILEDLVAGMSRFL